MNIRTLARRPIPAAYPAVMVPVLAPALHPGAPSEAGSAQKERIPEVPLQMIYCRGTCSDGTAVAVYNCQNRAAY